MISSLEDNQPYLISDAASAMKIDFQDAQCVVVCETISRMENYRFIQRRAMLVPEKARQFPRTLRNCYYREYRCSQRHRRIPTVKHPNPRQRRNRPSMATFDCEGIIKFVYRPSPKVMDVDSPLHPECQLPENALLVVYQHKLQHPGHENIVIPDAIREWLLKSVHASPRDAFRALCRLVEAGEFPNIAAHLITPHNVTYHWTLALQARIQTKGDPWQCAFDYVRSKHYVSVPSIFSLTSGGC
jgi:hypothetical protein